PCTKTPCSSSRRRLNSTTRAFVRPARLAAASSSALSTAQSAGVWFRKIRALASRYAAKLPCRSRWSGVTLSTAATRGWKTSVVSSWKLDTSHTTRPSAPNVSASAASGQPLLPPASPGRAGTAVLGEQRGRERGGRRLAVGPGDRDGVRLHRTPAQLQLTDDRDALRSGRHHQGRIERYPRAHDDQVGALRHLRVAAAHQEG